MSLIHNIDTRLATSRYLCQRCKQCAPLEWRDPLTDHWFPGCPTEFFVWHDDVYWRQQLAKKWH